MGSTLRGEEVSASVSTTSMTLPLEGKIALVTGAARGIGRAVCLEFARRGADVVAAGRQLATCEETAEAVRSLGRRAAAVEMDVADAAAVQRGAEVATAAFGRIDILVNNAGLTRDTLLMRMSDEDWDAVLDTNLKGAFLLTRAVVRGMMRQRSGAIVNVSSIVGLTGQAGQCNYAASKGGLIAFTKSAARELAGRGIRVNAIAPGFIQTRMTDALPEAVRTQMVSLVPLGRPGLPEDVARAAAFLASDDASYVTGQVLGVNGGMLM